MTCPCPLPFPFVKPRGLDFVVKKSPILGLYAGDTDPSNDLPILHGVSLRRKGLEAMVFPEDYLARSSIEIRNVPLYYVTDTPLKIKLDDNDVVVSALILKPKKKVFVIIESGELLYIASKHEYDTAAYFQLVMEIQEAYNMCMVGPLELDTFYEEGVCNAGPCWCRVCDCDGIKRE